MNSKITWLLIPTAATIPQAITINNASATIYLNEQQAMRSIFSNQKLIPHFVTLTSEQIKTIEKKSGVHVRNNEIKLWKSNKGEAFIIDEVLGKHEFITYALGISADNRIKKIEIMNYNESYGYEIRNLNWRNQFIDKDINDQLKLDYDISNISGATLSCRHITDGIKRILITYDLIKKNS